MHGFRRFFKDAEQTKDIHDTIAKLPKEHQDLVKGFKFHFESGNTLARHPGNVGLIVQDGSKKTITVAAPWNYGREYALLHEIAHLVFEKYMDDKWKKEWEKVVDRTKNKQKQNDEELFCMAYADYFAKNKIEIHHHPEWKNFIEKIIG